MTQHAWALLLEYDGTAFAGWQRQEGQPTLQEALETAAAHLTGGTPVRSVAAGRTDAGVHAAGQVAMLSLPGRYGAAQVRAALNFHLRPHAMVVLQAEPAPAGWNPRFSATGRTYAFKILNRRARPALTAGKVWHVERHLDVEAMTEAAGTLLGHHDFTSFRASSCQAKSPWRTLNQLDVTREDDVVTVTVQAQSFLHHQVRNIVGTLKLVGEGRWTPHQVAQALAARHRSAAGPTAPPQGLTLLSVAYTPAMFSPPPNAPGAAP